MHLLLNWRWSSDLVHTYISSTQRLFRCQRFRLNKNGWKLSNGIEKGGEQGGKGVEAKISPNTRLMQTTQRLKHNFSSFFVATLCPWSGSVEPHKASKVLQHHQTKCVQKKGQLMNYSILHNSKLKSCWLTLMCTISIARSRSRDKRQEKEIYAQHTWKSGEHVIKSSKRQQQTQLWKSQDQLLYTLQEGNPPYGSWILPCVRNILTGVVIVILLLHVALKRSWWRFVNCWRRRSSIWVVNTDEADLGPNPRRV